MARTPFAHEPRRLSDGRVEGVEALRTSGTADAHVTASIDSHLNEIGYIVPGLGDAGDRQFGVD